MPAALAVNGQGVQAIDLNVAPGGKAGFTLLRPGETGIAFTNLLSEWASAENRMLNNGSGVAAGDFDNDGRADLFFCSLNNHNALFRNLGAWRFEEVTEKTGLKFKPGFYRGAVFADLNGDGWLDLMVGTDSEGVLCFLNDGRGKFVDHTSDAGTRASYGSSTMTLADIDGNGTLDLYFSNTRKDDIRDAVRVPVMFVNGKPTVPPQLRDRLMFDNGQLLEFGEPDVFYLNDGGGHFKATSWTDGRFVGEQGQRLTGPPLDWGLAAAFHDLNDDSAPDLYVCNDFWTPDRLWINAGTGGFRLTERFSVRKTSFSSMGVAFADINRDGFVDVFVVDMLSRSLARRKQQDLSQRNTPTRLGEISGRPQVARNTLFLNRGDGTLAEIANLAGVFASEWSWSPVFLDVDLDGYEDLLITTGHVRDIQDLDATQKIQSLQNSWKRPNDAEALKKAFIEAKHEHNKLYPPLHTPIVAYRNRGDLRFEDATRSWGLDQPGVQHGIAVADLDNDGDLDFVVNRLGSAAGVYRNDGSAARIAVRLQGAPPNTQAIGAKVELFGGPVANQKQEVVSGGSYLSGSDTLLVLAPGSAQQGMKLRVTWRSRSITEITNVTPNKSFTISEKTAPRSPARPAAKASAQSAPFFRDVSEWLAHTHHEEPFNDLERQALIPRKLSQSGPGVAWFDINRDGWDDLVIGSGKGGRIAVFLNHKGGSFTPSTDAPFDAALTRDSTTALGWNRGPGETAVIAGLASYEDNLANTSCVSVFDLKARKLESAFPGHTASVGPLAMADIDSDGDLDLFVGGQVIPGRYPAAAGSLLFRQIEGKWFLDQETSRALDAAGLVNAAVWGDLNGDGFPELILACECGPVRIFRNEAGKFTAWNWPVTLMNDATRNAQHSTLKDLMGLWTGVTTGDLDGDGRLDIIAGNWGLNSSYRASREHPLEIYYGDFGGRGKLAVLEAEFDPELKQVVPSRRREQLISALPFLAERFPTYNSYSKATVADILHDRPDRAQKLSLTTLASKVFFNRNGKFEAKELPVEAQFAPVFSVNVADFDGDGNEDVFLSQNCLAFTTEEARLDSGRGLWLRGDGRGNLISMSGPASGVKIYGDQRGAALADFDKDGRVDLVVTQNGGTTKLYKNVKARPGVRVRLVGPDGNLDGVGSVVRLKYADGFGPAREIHAGSGYWSQDSSITVLGTAKTPAWVWVRWPGGQITEQPIARDAVEISIRK